jgi:hypothetical protein
MGCLFSFQNSNDETDELIEIVSFTDIDAYTIFNSIQNLVNIYNMRKIEQNKTKLKNSIIIIINKYYHIYKSNNNLEEFCTLLDSLSYKLTVLSNESTYNLIKQIIRQTNTNVKNRLLNKLNTTSC